MESIPLYFDLKIWNLELLSTIALVFKVLIPYLFDALPTAIINLGFIVFIWEIRCFSQLLKQSFINFSDGLFPGRHFIEFVKKNDSSHLLLFLYNSF